MAIWANHYLEIVWAMTPEERKQLSDSVASYDQNTRNKIIKAHLDARWISMWLTPAPNRTAASNKNDVAISNQRNLESAYIEKTGENPFTPWADPAAMTRYEERKKTQNKPTVASLFRKASPWSNKQVGMVDGSPAYQNSKGQTYIITANWTAAIVDTAKISPVKSEVPMISTPTGEVKWSIPTWGTIDNMITNNLVDKWVIPEIQRENIPQTPVTNPVVAPKKRYDRSIKDMFKSAITPYTPDQLAKAEASDLAARQWIKNVVKKVLPTPYTPEQLAKAEASDLSMRKKVGWFLWNMFKPYDFTSQVKK